MQKRYRIRKIRWVTFFPFSSFCVLGIAASLLDLPSSYHSSLNIVSKHTHVNPPLIHPSINQSISQTINKSIMYLSTVFSVFAIAATALSQGLNTSVEYRLRTQLKPGQADKARFDNLWLVSSHIGAGLSDVVLYTNQSSGIKGFLNATNATNKQQNYRQEFDLGNQFPWGMSVAYVNNYAAWEPVRIEAGSGQDGFYINSTGLQWAQYPNAAAGNNGFHGWLVCDWWHSVPQLFSKTR